MVEKVETIVEPESNTIQLQRTYSVFVSQGDSVARLRTLELGIEQGDRIEVLSGLNPGDKIIITGQQSLQDRGSIRVASGSDFQSPQQQQVAGDNQARNGQNRQARQGGGRPGQGGNPFQNMSEEDQAKMRQRLQNMSQEDRRAYMDSLRTANASGN
jgi:Fe2+ transport system protein FeoA